MLRSLAGLRLAPRFFKSFSFQAAPADQKLFATAINLDIKSKILEVEFNTGEKFRYPAEYLRAESPAADARRRSLAGTPTPVHGRRHVGIIDVEPVGSFAVRIQFDDLHGTGIFSWRYLHELGKYKFTRMRDYIRALRRVGLSRDPHLHPSKRLKAATTTPGST